MQVRQIFFFTISLVFLFLSENAFAQKVTVNDNGEKIVVYPDGSWHFYRETDADSIQMNMPSPSMTEMEGEAPAKGKRKKKKKSKGKKSKKKKSAKSKKGKNSKTSALFEYEERVKAVERAERAAAIEESTRLVEEESVFKRIFLEDELEEAYQSIDMTHEDIAAIEIRLQTAKDEETTAKSNYEKAQERFKVYERMIDVPAGKRKKLMAKMDDDLSFPTPVEQRSTVDTEMVATTNEENAFQQNTYESTFKQQRPAIRNYNPRTNLLRFPPAKPCNLAYNDIDEFSGKKRKQTEKAIFFTHTPDRFRSYFKGRDYLTCYGTLIAINGTPRSISIEYTIATDQAAREFGILEKGSQLILRLINGERLILVNNKTATGVVDPVSKTTTYITSYPLSKAQIKTLEEEEVDKVRMIWATGYEDYEVYLVDFFRDLFRCLEEG